MRIYLANDTSSFHAGCKASMQYLTAVVRKAGHAITQRTIRPLPPSEGKIDMTDCLLINGEGFMRYENKWKNERERIRLTRAAILYALQKRRKIMLVNTVWDRMSDEWKTILPKLDYISVREIRSATYMHTFGVTPEINLDFSYWAYDPPKREVTDSVLTGTCYRIMDFKKVTLPLTDKSNWSDIVSKLSRAGLYITGQHHGVYAACRARCPFVSVEVNSHKVTGLFEWAGVDIPILERAADLTEYVDWVFDNLDQYYKLFDFMESQEKWRFPNV